MKILVSWLREFVDVPVSVSTLAWDLNMAGFEVASISPSPAVDGTSPGASFGEQASPSPEEDGTSPGAGAPSPAQGVDAASGDPDAEDAVIDFEITANRPDCLSVIGMAREVATRYRTTFRPLTPPALAGTADDVPVRVEIVDAERCPRYTLAVADVTIGPSPAWMVHALAAAGVRSINNIVDITNYVLLETGHPIHAFDMARLGGQRLVIRTARPGETITTLDGQARTLTTDMLVIADAERAQAVAGVMGGAGSEVSSTTTTIAIESAYFQPASVRRTSKRLGLSTEASYRFERGADVNAPLVALARACELIGRLGAGTVRPGVVDAYPQPRPRTRVQLGRAYVSRMLGVAVADEDVERILTSLGCDLERADDRERDLQWTVGVPTWRNDLARDVDLVEEIARHHGYDHLPVTFPTLATPPAAPDPRLVRERAAKASASRAGFSEAVTFTFIERTAAEPFATAPEQLVAIANPLSEKFAVLRPSLLPGLVDSLAHNRRREQRDVRLYETGTRFSRDSGETRGIALALLGAGAAEHWSGTGREADFFDMKGAVESLGAGLGLRIGVAAAAVPYLVAGRAASLVAVAPDGERVVCGVIGELVPAIASSRGLPRHDAVFVAELDLDAVGHLVNLGEHIAVRPLPRHPSVVRDLSIIVPDTVEAVSLRNTIRKAAPDTLVDVREFARYQGAGVPANHVSLSFHFVFRAPERTLTDEEVTTSVEAILGALTTAYQARLR